MRFDNTPAALGFAMPAEWERHIRTWMAWPCRLEIWGDAEALMRARVAFARVARAIAEFETVVMVARPEDAREAEFACGKGIEVLPMPIDDSWMRDTGPVFLTRGKDLKHREVAGIDWPFNAWGGNHTDFAHDDALPSAILDHLRMLRFDGPMVLEGGAIAVDGEGTLLTTESCLLGPSRNPNLSREQVEERLAFFLGVRKIIWLPNGYEDDETDGHVDNVSAFAAPGRILLNLPSNEGDANFRLMSENRRALSDARDASGRLLDVIDMPQPARRDGPRGRLPLSYINFYVANDAVIAPSFDDPLDIPARRILAEAFPGREIVQVPSTDIVLGGGGIHCITQQEPLGVTAPMSERD